MCSIETPRRRFRTWRCSTTRAVDRTASRMRMSVRSTSLARTPRRGSPMPPGLPGSRRRRPSGRRTHRRRDAEIEPTREGRLLVVAGLALEARGLLRRLPPATRRVLTVRTVGLRAATLDRLDVARPPAPQALLVTGLAGGCG